MDYVVSMHPSPEQYVVSLRDRPTREDLSAFLGRAFGELYASLARVPAAPAGPPFVLYHEFGDDMVDAEVCLPVAPSVSSADTIDAHVLPPIEVASTTHVGPYEELAGAYEAVMRWIEERGFEMNGPVRERYLNDPGEATSPAEYRTVVEIPIVARAAAVIN